MLSIDTKLLCVSDEALAQAAKLLQRGQVVGLPTETVYGLFASALDDEAVARVFAAKGRPQDNPLIVHISDMEMLPKVVEEFTPAAQKLAKAFWPGPLTIVLPKAKGLASAVSAGLDTAGVRMPAHSAARAVIRQTGLPLAGPSANLSGGPSPTAARHVMQDMQGRIPLVIDGGDCPVGVESTVISLASAPMLLRPGFVTKAEIEEVLGQLVLVSGAVTKPLMAGEAPQSPGMKYRHYAPKAEITIINSSLENFINYVRRNAEEKTFALCFTGEDAKLNIPAVVYGQENNPETQATGLFAALRRLDEEGAKKVFARCPSTEGVGFAVYNRLLRAAAFRVVYL